MANEMELLAESVFKSMQTYMADRFKSMEANLREMVERAITEIPAPKDGLNGKDAIDGINGTNGKDGTCFLVGDGPPLTAGKAGDVYLDRATGDLYKCD